jgi:GTPase SAR1 family protein
VRTLLRQPGASSHLDVVCKRETAIQLAAKNNHIEIVKALLLAGAHPVCGSGKLLINWCYKRKMYGVVAVILKYCETPKFQNDRLNRTLLEQVKLHSPVRVVILGAAAAGKTTLTKIIDHELVGKYGEFPSENLATDGIAISKIGSYVFWDFGGQETLWSTHEFFMTEEAQYIIVVDLSLLLSQDEKQLEACLRSTRYWMNLVKGYTTLNGAPVLLVGTHCDLLHTETSYHLFTHHHDRDQAVQMLLDLAKQYDLHTLEEVYCVDKNEKKSKGVRALCKKIEFNAENIILKRRGMVKNNIHQLDFRFTALRMNIDEIRSEKPFVWWQEYINMCNSVGLSLQEDIHDATRFLVNFGSILTFRHNSTGGFSLVILDPEWLVNAFTSIVSVKYHTSLLKRGIFSRTTLERNWRALRIDSSTWPQLERLFELFQLMVKLPNGDYFVPAMLHAVKYCEELSPTERYEKFRKGIPPNSSQYARDFVFSRLAYGLGERLVIRILHYPGMDFSHFTCADDYYLISSKFQVRVRVIQTCNQLNIEVFSQVPPNDPELGFFCMLVFDSPNCLIKSYGMDSYVTKCLAFFNDQPLGDTDSIIDQTIRGFLNPSCPDLGLAGVNKLNYSDDSTYVTQRIGAGSAGVVWLGKLNGDEVVFKELRGNVSFYQKYDFIREVVIMTKVSNPFVVSLKGVCVKSRELIQSSIDCVADTANDPMAERGLLMILEYAFLGDLSKCHKELKKKSLNLKLKIALDIARGLDGLHSSEGVRFVHRDVRSQNVFMFSLDKKKLVMRILFMLKWVI